MVWKRLLFFAGIIFLLGLLSYYYPYITGEVSLRDYEKEACFVDRVIDGDTLVCNNETIRLLGIDTPEKGEFYYQEAKDFLMQVNGKEVEVLRDWDDLGKYKRKLRYIFYEGRMINTEILENGLGISFMTERLKYEKKLKKAEELARENCFGIWGMNC